MTLAELRQQLDALRLPGDTIVIIAKDSEGNRYSPLVEAHHAMYRADTTWAGEWYMPESQRLAEDDPDDWTQAPDDAVPAVFLWPTN
ncbi:hypothetical protein [Streptomyces sp. CBMA152]|uniref:hypothetical protein n=1 Tax=Streptomyces sp. CBMA152 TaxID=1896312 RepID=UPI0016607247|nr:hypothetical protein [Streptomyces sp. CBMA152]MBD0743523.1 hypothetical protein [Streptomyces sp. CBMA152]